MKANRVKVKKEPTLHVHRYICLLKKPGQGAKRFSLTYYYCKNLKDVRDLRDNMPAGNRLDVYSAFHSFREAWEKQVKASRKTPICLYKLYNVKDCGKPRADLSLDSNKREFAEFCGFHVLCTCMVCGRQARKSCSVSTGGICGCNLCGDFTCDKVHLRNKHSFPLPHPMKQEARP